MVNAAGYPVYSFLRSDSHPALYGGISAVKRGNAAHHDAAQAILADDAGTVADHPGFFVGSDLAGDAAHAAADDHR